MAENKANTKQPEKAVKNQDFDLQATADRATDFYGKNKKIINAVLIGFVIGVGAYFGYKRFVSAPAEEKAQVAIFQAQNSFAADSLSKALNGDGNNYGFLQVIDKYGSTKAGNLARYYAGVCHVRLGEYQKGIDQLKKFSSNDLVISSIANGLIGDAYMELNNANDAVSYYKKQAHQTTRSLRPSTCSAQAWRLKKRTNPTKRSPFTNKSSKNTPHQRRP